MNCQEVEPLLTPYVDGEATTAERERVAGHLAECGGCASRAAREQAARRVVQVRASALAVKAPPALAERCAAVAGGFSRTLRTPARAGSRGRWRALALAGATAVVALTTVVGYAVQTHSSSMLVAGLTLDHVKCFALHSGDGAEADARIVEAGLERSCGWRVRIPAGLAAESLTLVGGRRCLSSDGTTAHVMYRHGGRAVSLFVLPEGSAHQAAATSFAGYPARVWTCGSRTYVLVASESDAVMRPVVDYFRSAVN